MCVCVVCVHVCVCRGGRLGTHAWEGLCTLCLLTPRRFTTTWRSGSLYTVCCWYCSAIERKLYSAKVRAGMSYSTTLVARIMVNITPYMEPALTVCVIILVRDPSGYILSQVPRLFSVLSAVGLSPCAPPCNHTLLSLYYICTNRKPRMSHTGRWIMPRRNIWQHH